MLREPKKEGGSMNNLLKKVKMSFFSFLTTSASILLCLSGFLYLNNSIHKGSSSCLDKKSKKIEKHIIDTGDITANIILEKNCIKEINKISENTISISFKEFYKIGIHPHYSYCNLSEAYFLYKTNFNLTNYQMLAKDILDYVTDGQLTDVDDRYLSVNLVSDYLKLINGNFILTKSFDTTNFEFGADNIEEISEIMIPDLELIKKIYKTSRNEFIKTGQKYSLQTLRDYFEDNGRYSWKNSLLKVADYIYSEQFLGGKNSKNLTENEKILMKINEALAKENYTYEYKSSTYDNIVDEVEYFEEIDYDLKETINRLIKTR